MTLVTKKAPNFIAPAVLANGEIVNNYNFKKKIKNKISVLFFWPMDFTFVCPSELVAFNDLYKKFYKRKVQLIGISIDSVFVHQAWRNTEQEKGGIGPVNFPMISDIKRKIQKSYGIKHPELGISLRASFIIDQNRIIRHQLVNDLPLGRNIKETIRTIDALIFYQKNGEVCPANWKKGEKGMTPSRLGVKKYFLKKNKKK